MNGIEVKMCTKDDFAIFKKETREDNENFKKEIKQIIASTIAQSLNNMKSAETQK